jgi:hypothetical protein
MAPEAELPTRVVINNMMVSAWLVITLEETVQLNETTCSPKLSVTDTIGADIAGGAGGTIMVLDGELKVPIADTAYRAATWTYTADQDFESVKLPDNNGVSTMIVA